MRKPSVWRANIESDQVIFAFHKILAACYECCFPGVIIFDSFPVETATK